MLAMKRHLQQIVVPGLMYELDATTRLQGLGTKLLHWDQRQHLR